VRLTERIAFLKQFRRQLVATGAVQPSSRFLARAMTAPFRQARDRAPGHQLSVVEMGPGTGAVTAAIAEAMGAQDTLDCYEINREFADYLRRRLDTDPIFAASRDRITVHCAPAQEAAPARPADFVICSVPLNNLPSGVVRAIIERGFELLPPGGVFTFFEYPVLPRLKRLLSDAAERARIDAVSAVKQSYRVQQQGATIVLRNIPPARAVHMKTPSAPDAGSPRE